MSKNKQQNPSSLWGKPLPANLKDLLAKEPKMATEEYEDEFDPETADVADELEEGVDADDYLESADANEAAYTENEDGDEEDAYDAEDGDDAEVEYVESEAADTSEDPSHDDEVVAEEQQVIKQKKGEKAMKKRGSDYIREEIAKRREAGDSLRGVDIVKALAKKKVTVSAAQVSQLLKAEGVPSSGRGRPAATKAPPKKREPVAAAAPAAPEQSRSAAQRPKKLDYPDTGLPLDQLKAASAFLEACGGDYDEATNVLNMHRQVGSVMTR